MPLLYHKSHVTFSIEMLHHIFLPIIRDQEFPTFYENQVETLPNQQVNNSNQLTINKIEGVYQPDARVNQEEAEQIMHALNEIEPNQYDKFPSVGIICMTKEQRNLITYYLEQIKNRKVAGNERITRMEKTGLNAYYYRDIQDHHFDVVIVSTVFGVDAKNAFSKDIEELNEVESLQSLIDVIAILGKQSQVITYSFLEATELYT